MKILKKEDLKNQIKYTVSCDEKFWTQSQEYSYKILAKQLKVHGFRAGHVPALIAKKHISEYEVMNHALKKVVDHNFKLLVENEGFKQDEVIEEALSIEIVKIEPKILEIAYTFEKYPVVTLADYKKIKITYTEPKVEKHELEQEIQRYTKKDIMLIPKEEGNIVKGDMVNFDFKGFVDDKPFEHGEAKGHELEIGSNNFIPGFEEQMVGLKKGERKTIEVTFPKDYHSKDLANKKAKFDLVINEIKTIQRPKLDESYITRFAIPNVKTPEQFREYVQNQLMDYKKYHSKQNATKQISEWLMTHTKLSYMPKSLLDAEIKRLNEDIEKKATQAKTTANEYITTQLGYKNKTDFDKILVQSAEKNLHLIIGIEKIIDELKIEVSADELNKHLEKLARVYGSSIDDIKKRLNNNLDGIETFLLQEKMFDKLIEINKNNK